MTKSMAQGISSIHIAKQEWPSNDFELAPLEPQNPSPHDKLQLICPHKRVSSCKCVKEETPLFQRTTLPKTDKWGDKKKALPDEQSHGLAVQRKLFLPKKITKLRRFWVKKPRHTENVSAKKWCLVPTPNTAILACLKKKRTNLKQSILKKARAALKRFTPDAGLPSRLVIHAA